MKNLTKIIASFFTLLLCSCTSLKSSNTISNESWELEYITGPRIAFDGLFPENNPQITFNTSKNEVSGTTSCNGFTTKYTLVGNSITINQDFPMTMRYCEGGGEQVFLKLLKEINHYYIDNEGKLYFNKNDVPMMRFKKIIK